MSEPAAKKEYTLEEVSKHTSSKSCWLIIGNATNGTLLVYKYKYKYMQWAPGAF
jgi:hypothetical protein